ncbi:LOW QUALITY PROTEIN: acyl-coenzyme A thioesterase MBLAC2 [Excalfactoria chinensis]|uniref:LOW QUALITY PROTEIN: acyl-coenzyme A thioesterase MBLAC2 n=1 Tax=Excalfactoria chinensis TaxID=46218 RepID=UPI003B3A6C11
MAKGPSGAPSLTAPTAPTAPTTPHPIPPCPVSSSPDPQPLSLPPPAAAPPVPLLTRNLAAPAAAAVGRARLCPPSRTPGPARPLPADGLGRRHPRRIQKRFYESGNRANIWLVRGSQRDLVIDDRLGLRSLPDYLRDTHVHFDHSGGLQHLEEVAVHSAEAAALLRGDNYEAVTWMSDREVARPPRPGWRARHSCVPPVRPSRLLKEGQIIHLGDRQLTIMHMPGHSRGSICLYDQEHKVLFSGDVVYNGSMIDWLPYSNMRSPWSLLFKLNKPSSLNFSS